ncbi:MAG TPA: BON domain-containing protein [Sphingomicrobium sp.]|nr:BON domain-containing protein [Sphingomicrobium sp.]
MRKSDSQLQLDVMEELRWEPGIDHERIGVSTSNGVVALSGLVRSYAEKLLAEKTVRRVSGVRAVAEDLQVRYDWQPKTSDAEIAKRVADILQWDPMVPSGIEVTVEDGVVHLKGKVDWHYQRDLVTEDCSRITGVVRINNQIRVVSPVPTSDVRQRIEQAFERQADLEAEKITVVASGGKVTLSGRVSSWTKRNLAEQAAWAAPGVTQIEDNLVVA